MPDTNDLNRSSSNPVSDQVRLRHRQLTQLPAKGASPIRMIAEAICNRYKVGRKALSGQWRELTNIALYVLEIAARSR